MGRMQEQQHEARPGMPLLQPRGWAAVATAQLCTRCGNSQLYVERYFYGSGSTNALSSTYWLGLEKSGFIYYWLDGKNAGNGMVSNANPYAHFAYDYHDTATPALNCTIAHASRTYANYTGAWQPAEGGVQAALRCEWMRTARGENTCFVRLQVDSPSTCKPRSAAPPTIPTSRARTRCGRHCSCGHPAALPAALHRCMHLPPVGDASQSDAGRGPSELHSTPGPAQFGWYPVSCAAAYQFVCEVPFSAMGCKAPPPAPPPHPPTNLCLPPTNDTGARVWLHRHCLHHLSCLALHPCAVSVAVPTARPTPHRLQCAVVCPPGGESCYFWYSRSRTWGDAKAECKKNPGAFLISYNTAQEQVGSWGRGCAAGDGRDGHSSIKQLPPPLALAATCGGLLQADRSALLVLLDRPGEEWQRVLLVGARLSLPPAPWLCSARFFQSAPSQPILMFVLPPQFDRPAGKTQATSAAVP